MVDEKVEGLADASAECNHSEVTGVCRVAFLVEKFHNRFTPGGRRAAHRKHFCEQCGKNVVSTFKLEKH